jgi:uncharacterized membrane protein YeaQ/YmgE (transglycosylase-associated protein family)
METIGQILNEHNWFWWIVIGGVAGLLARMLMPGKDRIGCLFTIVLGVTGAVLVALIGNAMGLGGDGDRSSLISATVGALLILMIYRAFERRRR